MNNSAERMRGAARRHARKVISAARRRKEEYVGARVPRELKARVLHRAEVLGIPVSLLIRNVLERAFVEENPPPQGAPQAADATIGHRYPGILGWEVIRLNKKVNCSQCGSELSTGSNVTLGLAETGGENVVLCGRCMAVD